MRQRVAHDRAIILIVGHDAGQAWRLAAALRAHVLSARRLSDDTTAGWRVADRRQRGLRKPEPAWPMRLLPPRLSTLPAIEVQYARPEELARPDGGEAPVLASSELLKVDGFLLLFDGAGAGWADWARALVQRLDQRRDARLGGRIASSVAVVDLRARQGGGLRQTEDELRELAEVLLAHCASAKVAPLSLSSRASSDQDTAVRREVAGLVLWGLTAIDRLALEPGLAGALARTPSPALGWYALVMWLFVVVVPSLPHRIAGAACAALRATRCVATTRAAVAELRDLDLPVVAAAVFTGTLVFVVATILRQRRRRTGDNGAIGGETRFRRTAGSALLAAWVVALVPRTLLASYALGLSGLGVSVGRGVLETALFAADFRGPTLVGTLVVSLAVLSVVNVVGRRRPMQLHEARERARSELRARRR